MGKKKSAGILGTLLSELGGSAVGYPRVTESKSDSTGYAISTKIFTGGSREDTIREIYVRTGGSGELHRVAVDEVPLEKALKDRERSRRR